MGRGEDWRGVSTGLGRGFFRVAADLPGHGASLRMPPERYAMEGAARSVLDVLDGAGVGGRLGVRQAKGRRGGRTRVPPHPGGGPGAVPVSLFAGSQVRGGGAGRLGAALWAGRVWVGRRSSGTRLAAGSPST